MTLPEATPDSPRSSPDLVRSVRGVRDWLPDEYAPLVEVRDRVLDTFKGAGARLVELPILEYAELHERRSGGRILAKLFAFDDRRGRRLCLRPEVTASALRAIAEAKWASPPVWPMRIAYSGRVFRYEKPGRLRWREFTQLGIEVLGAPPPLADAEVCALALTACDRLGLTDATLRLGHMGVVAQMLRSLGLPMRVVPLVLELLDDSATATSDIDADAFAERLRELASWGAPTSRSGAATPADEPLSDAALAEVLDSLHHGEGAAPVLLGRRTREEVVARWRSKRETLSRLGDSLRACHEMVTALARLSGPPRDVLPELRRIAGEVAPEAVGEVEAIASLLEQGASTDIGDRVRLHFGFGRGLQFYSGMIASIRAPDASGQPIELGGGGRYDGFATMLGSSRDPRGVGFSFGLDRLHLVLTERGLLPQPPRYEGVLVAAATDDAHAQALRIAAQLREAGVTALLHPTADAKSAQRFAADRGLAGVVLVGADGIDDDKVALGTTGGQRQILPLDPIETLRDAIRNAIQAQRRPS